MNTRTEQLIESYFDKTLNEAETLELKKLLAADPAAAAEFQWQQRLAKTTSKLSLSGGIRNETFKESVKPPFRRVIFPRKLWAAAATIALLAAALWFIKEPLTRPADLQTVVADNFLHYPNRMPFKSLGVADSSMAVPQSVIDAFDLYDDPARAGEAAQALNIVVAAHPGNNDYRFYWGVALLADGRHSAAADALLPVTESDNAYKIPAYYYLGLALAGKGDLEGARSALQSYLDSEDGVTYRKQAGKVLEAIGKTR